MYHQQSKTLKSIICLYKLLNFKIRITKFIKLIFINLKNKEQAKLNINLFTIFN